MKTVDALIATKNFFTSNPAKWGTGSLFSHENGCFCVLGGISLVTGCMTDAGEARTLREGEVAISCISGPSGVEKAGEYRPIGSLSRSELAPFLAAGVDLVAAKNAVRYLRHAVEAKGVASIAEANDTMGHWFIMGCLDLAIKNAKRRHINGDKGRSRSSKPVAARSAVAA